MNLLIAIIMCLVGYFAVYAACTLQQHPQADPSASVTSPMQRIGIMVCGTCLLVYCSKIILPLAIITLLVGIIFVFWGSKEGLLKDNLVKKILWRHTIYSGVTCR